MTEQQINLKIIEKSKDIAKIIARGRDVEIRKSNGGIKIYEIGKKIMS